MVDFQQIFEILKSGSSPEPQARAMAQAIQKAESDVTFDVKGVLVNELRNEQKIAEERFNAFEERMDRKLAETKWEILRWSIGLWLAQLAAVAGIVKMLK